MDRSLEELRSKLDSIDNRILELLLERARIVEEIARVKRRLGIPALDEDRERNLISRARSVLEGREGGDLALRIYERIIEECRRFQEDYLRT